MNVLVRWLLLPLASSVLIAQATSQRTSSTSPAKHRISQPATVTADDIRALREALAAQQQQIQELRQQFAQRDQQAQQQAEILRQLQAATESQRAPAIQTTAQPDSNETATVAQLKSEVNDVKRSVM